MSNRFKTIVATLAWLCASSAWAQGAVPVEYLLAVGDHVRISVFQNPDLSTDVRIPDGGDVAMPLVGNVHIGGLSLVSAQRVISGALVSGHYVRDPQVSVTLTEVHGNQASVLGFALRPGRYALESTATRLSDLMAEAGGVSPEGSESLTVTGSRDGKPFRITVDFRQLSTGADQAHDLVLRNNDVVYVARAPQVYIYGEVQKPGSLRLEPGMRLLQALAAAGGPTLRGTQRGIRVSRLGPDGALVETTPGPQTILQPEDVIFVPASLF